MATEPRVISISRRTDIPALHSAWLAERIAAGWVAYANPFTRRPVLVNLAPEAVRALVFWTRNPHPLLPLLDDIDARYERRHYLHLTITGMNRRFETHGPTVRSALLAAEALARRYGPGYVQWRFDPIIVSDRTPVNEVLGRFGALCGALAGLTTRCTVSFLDAYRGSIGHLDRAGIIVDPDYVSGGAEDLVPQVGASAGPAARHRRRARHHGADLHRGRAGGADGRGLARPLHRPRPAGRHRPRIAAGRPALPRRLRLCGQRGHRRLR